jgi:hypothetical protein
MDGNLPVIMSKYPAIVVGEFKYVLTDYRVEKYDLLTGQYIESGLEFKHDNAEFDNLLTILWDNYTKGE